MTMTYEEYCVLVGELNKASSDYYVKGESDLTDFEFDEKIRAVRLYEESVADKWVLESSPTLTVGHQHGPNARVRVHEVPMLSLNDGDVDATKVWLSKLNSAVVMAEHKIDGLACSLLYQGGRLVSATTRGDGRAGEDITDMVALIPDVPKFIDHPGTLVVRGEVHMPLSEFTYTNLRLEQFGADAYKTPRNAAAGIVNSRSTIFERLPLSFFAYDSIIDNPGEYGEDGTDIIQRVKDLGFKTTHVIKAPADEIDLDLLIKDVLAQEHDFAADGIVFKVDDKKLRVMMGVGSRAPNWAFAYKYPGDVGTTTVKDVSFNIGKTGKIIPIANFEAIELGGVTVQNVNLGNTNKLASLDVRVGQVIEVIRFNDVSPQIKHIEYNSDLKPITIEYCPDCEAKLVNVGNQGLYCPNSTGCPTQLTRTLQHFTSKKGLFIRGFNEQTIIKLLGQGLTSVVDLLHLTQHDLVNLGFDTRTASTKANAIIAALREVKLSRLISALAISGVSDTSARTIAKSFILEGDKLKYIGESDNRCKKFTLWYTVNSGIFNRLVTIIMENGNLVLDDA